MTKILVTDESGNLDWEELNIEEAIAAYQKIRSPYKVVIVHNEPYTISEQMVDELGEEAFDSLEDVEDSL